MIKCLQQEVGHVTTTMSHILDMLWQPYTSRLWLSSIWLSSEMSSFWRNIGRWTVTGILQQLRHSRFNICRCDRYVICFCGTPMRAGGGGVTRWHKDLHNQHLRWQIMKIISICGFCCAWENSTKSARPIMTMFRPKWCNAQKHKDIFWFRVINSPRKWVTDTTRFEPLKKKYWPNTYMYCA